MNNWGIAFVAGGIGAFFGFLVCFYNTGECVPQVEQVDPIAAVSNRVDQIERAVLILHANQQQIVKKIPRRVVNGKAKAPTVPARMADNRDGNEPDVGEGTVAAEHE